MSSHCTRFLLSRSIDNVIWLDFDLDFDDDFDFITSAFLPFSTIKSATLRVSADVL